LLERNVNIPTRREEQGRIRQRAADGYRVDVRGQRLPGVESGDGEGFARRPGCEWLADQLVPDGLGDAVRVARAGRERVDDQEVNPVADEFDGLDDERGDRVLAVLVAGRDDLRQPGRSSGRPPSTIAPPTPKGLT
jgi:hypothetical protein